MRYLLPLTLLAVLGCYSPRAIGAGEPGPAMDGGWANGELEARLWFDELTGMASFDVNRPAHVAIFAQRPGAALEMIYPSIGYGGGNERFAGGSHWVRTAGSPHRFAGNWSTVYGAGPVYIIMIASEQPLRVAPFMAWGRSGAPGHGPWLHRARFMYSPYMAIESIAREIVPSPGNTEWTSAIHVIWPREAFPRAGMERSYVHVQCPGGVVLTVPVDAWRAGYVQCPQSQTPADSTQVDSTGTRIRDQLPERGLPPGWRAPERSEDGRVRAIAEGLRVQRPGGPVVTPVELSTSSFRRTTGPTRTGELAPRPIRVPDRTRSSTRSSDDARPSRRTTSRPETRPAPSRPQTRPAPSRPDPPAKPEPKPKPKPDPDGA